MNIVENDGSNPDAVWHHRSDGSRDEAGSGVWGSAYVGVLLGANLGRAIVTNGDVTAYVYDSAATLPSSQNTLGRLVIMLWPLCPFTVHTITPFRLKIGSDQTESCRINGARRTTTNYID